MIYKAKYDYSIICVVLFYQTGEVFRFGLSRIKKDITKLLLNYKI